VNGDTSVEDDETFTVTLTNVLGATIADGSGLGTIANDDAAARSISNAKPKGGLARHNGGR
jgi:chitinase